MTFQAFTKTITAALCGAALATAVSAQEDAVLTVTAGDMEQQRDVAPRERSAMDCLSL